MPGNANYASELSEKWHRSTLSLKQKERFSTSTVSESGSKIAVSWVSDTPGDLITGYGKSVFEGKVAAVTLRRSYGKATTVAYCISTKDEILGMSIKKLPLSKSNGNAVQIEIQEANIHKTDIFINPDHVPGDESPFFKSNL